LNETTTNEGLNEINTNEAPEVSLAPACAPFDNYADMLEEAGADFL
jgi:hypothetical protein